LHPPSKDQEYRRFTLGARFAFGRFAFGVSLIALYNQFSEANHCLQHAVRIGISYVQSRCWSLAFIYEQLFFVYRIKEADALSEALILIKRFQSDQINLGIKRRP
jgi:hypothetical protein